MIDLEERIKLVKDIGADAVHPGYGFFSENADFITALEKEKITFIGPSSKSVKMMGNKTSARKLMADNKVPIVPGTTKEISSVKRGLEIAEEIGYPVALKIVSPDILHKVDMGGVKIKLQNKEKLVTGYHEIIDGVKKVMPDAQVWGVLVQQMAEKGITTFI